MTEPSIIKELRLVAEHGTVFLYDENLVDTVCSVSSILDAYDEFNKASLAYHKSSVEWQRRYDLVVAERDALRDQWSDLLIEQARLMALRDDAVAERDAAEQDAALLRDAAEPAMKYIAWEVSACNGMKCREGFCQSCFGDDEAEAWVAKARAAYVVLSGVMYRAPALDAALAVQP